MPFMDPRSLPSLSIIPMWELFNIRGLVNV